MKILLLFIALFFIGCETAKDKEKRLEQEKQEKLLLVKNINNGGSGTPTNPYLVSNGIIGTTNYDSNTYYKFTKNSFDCKVLFYDSLGHYTDYKMYNSFNQEYDLNSSKFNYKLYNNIVDDSYIFTSEIDRDSSRLGLFSNCIEGLFSYALSSPNIGYNPLKESETKLFKINLESNNRVIINESTNIGEIHVFDNNLSILFSGDSYDNNLTLGIYYFLISASSKDSIFYYDNILN